MSPNEQRKFTRLTVILDKNSPPIEAAFATIEMDGLKIRRPIQNISYRGVGLVSEKGDLLKLKNQKKVNLTLEIEDTLAKTSAEIAHLGEEYIGISFMALDDVSRRIISAYLDPRYLGNSLKEVPAAMLKNQQQRLYLGNNNTRLALLVVPVGGKQNKKTKAKSVEIILQGRYCTASAEGVLETGALVSPFSTAMLGSSLETSSVKKDPQPDKQLLHDLLRLLRYAPLPIELRLEIEVMLQR